VFFGREGNRRCGVALAMRQTISYIQHSSYGLSGLTEKDEQPPALLMGYCIIMAALCNRGGHYIFAL